MLLHKSSSVVTHVSRSTSGKLTAQIWNRLWNGKRIQVTSLQVPSGPRMSRTFFSTRSRLRRHEEDSENFWRVAADDLEFWNSYVSTRPNYSADFYNEMYMHHAAHSSVWDMAHDVGCGAGQVTAELAKRFQHVVASDINDTHVTVSKRRLHGFSSSQVSFTHSKGEELYQHHPSGSADMIAVAEAMVLMDEEAGLNSFSRLLKPGGTFAAWFYGRPTFADASLRDRAQSLIDQIMVRNWAKVIQGSGKNRLAGFKRAADGMASWLDYLPFDSNTWTDVHRIKWNPSATLPFFGEEACGFAIDSKPSIKQGERCEERLDDDWWRNDWNQAELKRYFSVLFPGFKEAIGEGDTQIDNLFSELAAEMGGEKAVCQFTWPVVLVLATRR